MIKGVFWFLGIFFVLMVEVIFFLIFGKILLKFCWVVVVLVREKILLLIFFCNGWNIELFLLLIIRWSWFIFLFCINFFVVVMEGVFLFGILGGVLVIKRIVLVVFLWNGCFVFKIRVLRLFFLLFFLLIIFILFSLVLKLFVFLVNGFFVKERIWGFFFLKWLLKVINFICVLSFFEFKVEIKLLILFFILLIFFFILLVMFIINKILICWRVGVGRINFNNILFIIVFIK